MGLLRTIRLRTRMRSHSLCSCRWKGHQRFLKRQMLQSVNQLFAEVRTALSLPRYQQLFCIRNCLSPSC
jgi:hypothetical protein